MKMIQDGAVMTQVEDDRQAYDGGNKEYYSPNQAALDSAWAQVAPEPSQTVYNIQTTQISGTQKLMLYIGFGAIVYLMYKKFKK